MSITTYLSFPSPRKWEHWIAKCPAGFCIRIISSALFYRITQFWLLLPEFFPRIFLFFILHQLEPSLYFPQNIKCTLASTTWLYSWWSAFTAYWRNSAPVASFLEWWCEDLHEPSPNWNNHNWWKLLKLPNDFKSLKNVTGCTVRGETLI